MIGAFQGTPEQMFDAARDLFLSLSPLGRVRRSEDGSEIVFETVWAKGVHIERLPLRGELPCELVRHAGFRSFRCTVYDTAGTA